MFISAFLVNVAASSVYILAKVLYFYFPSPGFYFKCRVFFFPLQLSSESEQHLDRGEFCCGVVNLYRSAWTLPFMMRLTSTHTRHRCFVPVPSKVAAARNPPTIIPCLRLINSVPPYNPLLPRKFIQRRQPD